MSRRLTAFLTTLYAVLAAGLIHAAITSQQHDSWAYTAFFTAASIGFAVATLHHSLLRDEIRYAHAQIDAALRPAHDEAREQDDVVQLVLATWCCDAAVITAGTEHDPEHCTRKDSTT